MRHIIFTIFAAFLCSGCALTQATIDVPYQSLTSATPIPGASGITVSVTTTDERTAYRDRVGTKKNGYGMEMASIVSSNNIPDTVRDAFIQELSARGFKAGTNGLAVNIHLLQFYNDFKAGFFSGDAISNVAFNVEVAAPNGTILFTKYYIGTGKNPNIQLAGGSEAQPALIQAFQTAVASAVNDPDFINALLHGGAKLS